MNKENEQNLFNPIKMNGLELINRIIMAPMTRSRALNNIPTDLMVEYYKQRATAGLIITEGNAPSPNGLGYARIPGMYNAEQIDGWKKVTKAVHSQEGKIFTQLMHVGRIAHSTNMPIGSKILAPSAVSANADMWTDSLGMQKTEMPSEMTHAEIQSTINEFVNAAKNAIEAGFDGIELHAANGYLLEQFLNPNSNQRTDNYGGTIENRCAFILEVSKAVIQAIGNEKVGIRISPYSTFNSMPTYNEIYETYLYLTKELDKLKLQYVHVIDYAARGNEEGSILLKEIRKYFSNTLILNGGYTKERAINALHNGEADLISFGSTFISNPDLPFKLKNNLELTKADPSTFYTADEKGYTDYPSTKTNA